MPVAFILLKKTTETLKINNFKDLKEKYYEFTRKLAHYKEG